jgi:hypothetical protein
MTVDTVAALGFSASTPVRHVFAGRSARNEETFGNSSTTAATALYLEPERLNLAEAFAEWADESLELAREQFSVGSSSWPTY